MRKGRRQAVDSTRTWEIAAGLEEILEPGADLLRTRAGWYLRKYDSWTDPRGQPRDGWRTVDTAADGALGALLIRYQNRVRGMK